MYVRNSLKKLDMFGAKVELFISKESTFKTAFGGVMTIIVWVFFLVMVVPRFKDLVTRAEVNAVEKIRYSPSEGQIVLGRNGLMVAFGFANSLFNNYVNFSLIGRKNIRNSSTGAITKIKIEISLERCTLDHFPDLEKNFKEINLSGFLCPSINQSWSLSGTYTDEIFNFLQIKISECKNVSKCMDRTAFFSKNPQLDFNVFLTSHDNNPRDIHMPLVKKITSELHFLLDNREVNMLYKEADIFLRTLQVSFDREIILPVSDNKIFDGIMYNNEIKEQISVSTNNGELANFYFRKSPYIVDNSPSPKEVEREFYTFGEFFAFFGGAWSQLFFTFYFFAMYYNRRKYLNKLANRFYNFKLAGDDIKMNTESLRNAGYHEAKSPEVIKVARRKSIKDILSEMYEYFSKGNYLKSNFLETFLGSCLKKLKLSHTKKLNLLETSYDCISEDLDLTRLIRAVHDLERLKRLFLNNDQATLFDYAPKPIIKYNPEKNKVEKLVNNRPSGRSNSITIMNGNPDAKAIHILNDKRTIGRLSMQPDSFESYINLLKTYFLTKKRLKERDKKDTSLDFLDENLITKLEDEIRVLKDINYLPDEEIENIFKDEHSIKNKFSKFISPETFASLSKQNEKYISHNELENVHME